MLKVLVVEMGSIHSANLCELGDVQVITCRSNSEFKKLLADGVDAEF